MIEKTNAKELIFKRILDEKNNLHFMVSKILGYSVPLSAVTRRP